MPLAVARLSGSKRGRRSEMCDVRAALGLVPNVEAAEDAARDVDRRAEDDDMSPPLYAEDCLPLSVTVGLIVTY